MEQRKLLRERARRTTRARRQRGGNVTRNRITRRRTQRMHINDKSFPDPGPSQCHPRVGATGLSRNGCFPDSVWQEVARNQGGAGTAASTGQKGGRAANMKAIAAQLGIAPTHQRSILNALPLSQEKKEELARLYLRPAQPANWKEDPDMWLDSNNIADVMRQYEEINRDFVFLGPYPIDFAAKDPYTEKKKCIIGEMCSMDLDREKTRGKSKIGIVYNLDPHYKDGSHWVANYIDIPKKKLYYFDSYGMEPPAQVRKFMQWLTIQEPALKLAYNGRRFQFKDSECGMYCLYFLIRMIMGDSFRRFVRHSPPDTYMLDLRDYLFST